ncbi:hypothetical protein GCM10010399_92960 [Dactylosporangium fulvum]|uniref:PIN domain-containing protein n=1 Tax=Dactylosporangium fulvum TaxID=53359 RepID=A0ABY5W9Q5_9ACTN|nr:hypothetical protein [Dactylosporangium fulvum]UWP85831.1 hypothetical protein Dfulv_16925 [Dactylosporangium fulvum]
MIDAQLTLDTSAVLAYVAGSTGLGELLGEVAEEKRRFAVPAACLVEAGLQLDEASWPMLDVLAGHPSAVVVGLDAAEWKAHASAAALFGSAGAGAAALLVAQGDVWYVATLNPDAYGDGIDTVLIED